MASFRRSKRSCPFVCLAGDVRVVALYKASDLMPDRDRFAEFEGLIRKNYRILIFNSRKFPKSRSRLDKSPGGFKTKENQTGNTVFVAPDLVNGTLELGFEFLQGFGEPFHRAVFMMFLVSEVHPSSTATAASQG